MPQVHQCVVRIVWKETKASLFDTNMGPNFAICVTINSYSCTYCGIHGSHNSFIKGNRQSPKWWSHTWIILWSSLNDSFIQNLTISSYLHKYQKNLWQSHPWENNILFYFRREIFGSLTFFTSNNRLGFHQLLNIAIWSHLFLGRRATVAQRKHLVVSLYAFDPFNSFHFSFSLFVIMV